MGASGSATFTNGVLSLNSSSANGFIISDDAAAPSSRGGVGMSQFFGLNDLFRSAGNSIQTTGIATADTAGFNAGGSIKLLLKGPLGERVNETTVSITGSTVGNVITQLNTAFAGNAVFALDASGKLSMTPSSILSGYSLEVMADTTTRGATGVSLTQLFGLGGGEALNRAQGFALASGVSGLPQRLAFAQSSLTSTTTLGTSIAGSGDNRGLLALQALGTKSVSFQAGGGLLARTTTLNDYAATFYQDASARGTAIEANRAAQDTRLSQAKQAQSSSEGVNMDDELAKMMSLQQAYNAGARLLKVVQDLFDELLNAV